MVRQSHLGIITATTLLPFFFEDPKKYWWMGAVIALGSALIIDDIAFHLFGDSLFHRIISE